MTDAHTARGDAGGGEFRTTRSTTRCPGTGMVVLDAIHSVQALQAGDLACRWNCKAGRCGSCSAEVNGKPRLMCMDRIDKYPPASRCTSPPDEDLPGHQGPGLRRLVELRGQRKRSPRSSRARAPTGNSRRGGRTGSRSSASASSASCARTSATSCATTTRTSGFGGPRFFVRVAALEMHPLDADDRTDLLQTSSGSASATSPSAAPRSARSASHHRQRHHPPEGARRGPATTRSCGSGARSVGAASRARRRLLKPDSPKAVRPRAAAPGQRST